MVDKLVMSAQWDQTAAKGRERMATIVNVIRKAATHAAEAAVTSGAFPHTDVVVAVVVDDAPDTAIHGGCGLLMVAASRFRTTAWRRT